MDTTRRAASPEPAGEKQCEKAWDHVKIANGKPGQGCEKLDSGGACKPMCDAGFVASGYVKCSDGKWEADDAKCTSTTNCPVANCATCANGACTTCVAGYMLKAGKCEPNGQGG